MDRLFLTLGSLSGALGVIFGAFGAHALRGRLTPEQLGTFEIGVRYQMFHAVALVLVALIAAQLPGQKLIGTAGWLFVAGTLIFSGSLYLLTLTGQRWLGAITPIGGVALIAGWICLALAGWR